MLKNLKDLPVSEEDRVIIKNQGGGYVNHNLYWQVMGPKMIDEKLVLDLKNMFLFLTHFLLKLKLKVDKHTGRGHLIDAIYKKTVRPKLIQPCFLVGHPLETSPLAKKDPANPQRI